MSIQPFVGRPFLLGPDPRVQAGSGIVTTGLTLNAANMSVVCIGRVRTSDGASHTIDTTGSSNLAFRSGAPNTFANGGTTVKIGIATVDTSNGPPGRATNSTNVITFDVAAVVVGGVFSWPSNQWISVTPTTGSKTLADGDRIAFGLQMTARGGSDAVNFDYLNNSNGAASNLPEITQFNGSSYSAKTGAPNGIVRFSDGAYGWIEGGDIFDTINTRSWNSSSGTKEYGQLITMPFPMRVCGMYAMSPGVDCDFVLYSDPLGTPVAQRTVSMVAKTQYQSSGQYVFETFSSPYDVPANTPIGAVLKPGASSATAFYKTLNHADHRIAEAYGTSGYGISRNTGAFSNDNSSLNNYYIGLMLSGFGAGGGAGVIGG